MNKKILAALITVLILLASPASARWNGYFIPEAEEEEELTCTLLINQTASGEGYYYVDTAGQKIKGAVGKICKITLTLYHVSSGSSTDYLEIWSDVNRSGTQFGGSSTNQSVDTNYAEKTFEWSSNYPEPTGDFYIHLRTSSETNLYITGREDPTAYEDTNYDLFSNSTDQNQDATFSLWTMQ